MFCMPVYCIMAMNAILDVNKRGNVEGLEGSMNLLASLIANISLGLFNAATRHSAPWCLSRMARWIGKLIIV